MPSLGGGKGQQCQNSVVWKQEDCEFQANLGYSVRLWFLNYHNF